MPLFFAPYENYVLSINSFFEDWNWMEGFNICQGPIKYGQAMFFEAVKVDVENSKKKTISSNLSLITVLFEDLFEAINLHREFSGEKK